VLTEGTLARLETILEVSGVGPSIELRLASGGRPRQLSTTTLFLGMLLCQADGRPAHLTRVHQALVALPETDRRRLGIEVDWKSGPHLLTYRQVERTFSVVVHALDKDTKDGEPSDGLCGVLDALLEASVPEEWKGGSRSLAVDWSDLESFSNPPADKDGPCADPEASWGRRAADAPGVRDELFFGYELGAATMVRDDDGPPVPELARRMLVTACHVDPPRAFVAVLSRLVHSGIALGDVLCDSGYSHRIPEHWALPLRALGADLVFDLHPHDRGPQGTFAGAVVANGNLYCPATPVALLALGPLARGASPEAARLHDTTSAELSRHKLGRISTDDADGFHRRMCPAAMGKLRCPLRPESMTLAHTRPEVLSPPVTAPACCTQRTVTVPPTVAAKTAQKHDYPSKAHRLSYGRRTAVERTFSTAKDPATNDISRGWCRVMGVTAMSLFIASVFVVRNVRILDAFEAREAENRRRIANGLAPKTRQRRRRTIADLVGAAPNGPPP